MNTSTSTRRPLIHTYYWGNQQPGNALNQRAQFRPPKLPYSYGALNVLSDFEHLKNHFWNYHMKGFEEFLDRINNTNAEKMGMTQIFAHQDEFDDILIDAAGGVYNHQLFWDNLSPYGGEITKQLEDAINYSFGSVFKMKLEFIQLGKAQNCCSWLWLIINEENELKLVTTTFNNNTLMKNCPEKGIPILAVDLWEHAYCQKFKEIEDYLKTVWMLINWTEVSARYRFAF